MATRNSAAMRPSIRSKTIAALALLWLVATSPVSASDPIILDSVFSDWAGEGNITDPTGRACAEDIAQFWWADNAGESFTYWRLDRRTCQKKSVTYVVFVDTNNDGVFTDNVDREVVVDYAPLQSSSDVDLTVRHADTDVTISQLTNQDWGDDKTEGGMHVEFRASFTDLGITVNQTIRMYVQSFKYQSTIQKDRAPDTGDIQWSPVNILGYALLAGLMLAGVLLIWRFRGRYAWTRP